MTNYKIEDLDKQKKYLKELLEKEIQQQLQALSIEELKGIRESMNNENSIIELHTSEGWQ